VIARRAWPVVLEEAMLVRDRWKDSAGDGVRLVMNDASDFEAIGVYDPAAPHAARQLEPRGSQSLGPMSALSASSSRI
jgi:hypothetical protein